MKRIVSVAPFLLAIGVLRLFICGTAYAQLQPIPLQGSTAAEGSHVFAGTIFSGITVNWQSASTARYLMLFDATALPANGSTSSCSAAQASGCLAYCLYLPSSASAPNSFTLDWTLHPVPMRKGVVAALSTGAGCGTLTVDGSNDFFYAQVR